MDTAKEILFKSIRYAIQAYMDLCLSETEATHPFPAVKLEDAVPEDSAAVEAAWAAAHSAREAAVRDAGESLRTMTDCATECQLAYNQCIQTQSEQSCNLQRTMCLNNCNASPAPPKEP